MPRAARKLAVVEREIDKLREQLLPAVFDHGNNYPDGKAVQTRTRAFLVLAHAEFESYLEEWARELVTAAHLLWKKKGRITSPLGQLLATEMKPLTVPQNVPTTATDDMVQRYTAYLNKAVGDYLAAVNDNHGIKEANLATLFGRLGLPASALGTTLLPALSTYGERRGKHAHNSTANIAVISVLDPQDEFNRAKQMIAELQPLHAWFLSARKAIR